MTTIQIYIKKKKFKNGFKFHNILCVFFSLSNKKKLNLNWISHLVQLHNLICIFTYLVSLFCFNYCILYTIFKHLCSNSWCFKILNIICTSQKAPQKVRPLKRLLIFPAILSVCLKFCFHNF